MTTIQGLSAQEVIARRRQGQGNDIELSTSRSLKDIILSNVFNPVNVVLYVIGAGLFLVGDARSAIATVGLIVFNAAVGIIQETRAKQQLDQIALLARAKVTVFRDGQEQAVDPSELVLGDTLLIQSGDQIPVDGQIVGDGKIEVDESALTGESDLIQKTPGEKVLSGSFCVTGKTLVEATAVGEQSFANKLTKDAREFKLDQTPLQRQVNQLLRILLLLVLFFGFLAVLALFVLDLPVGFWLQIIAVITGSVSAGLLTLITLNYSWGAVRISQKGGLVQQINAIESLSNVTVLCTDKTGTLTANKIKYHDLYPVGLDKSELEHILADFAAGASSTNKTSEAIIEGLPGSQRSVSDEVPFSSARKWSAIAFDDPAFKGAYVLGAFEMLRDKFTMPDAAHQQLQSWSDEGLRVLVFAGNRDVTTLHDATGEPMLPPLTLLGIISFSDELRPHLQETLSSFTSNGVKLKVISGDNPQTVAALAKQAGLPGDLKAVSGPELAEMSPGQFAQVAGEATVFGRITPQQKEALVDALQGQGEYVAMMGDGVNDVLSLKKSNMGIAMESGSSATRSVAAMILLGDSFEAMPEALTEGQRIVNSIQNILKLFMVTVFALLLLIIGISFLQLGFPFTTLQSTLLSLFSRGIPPLILAVVARPGREGGSLYKNLLHFTLPASILLFIFGLLIYIGAFFAIQNDLAEVVVTPEVLAELQRYTGVTYEGLTDAQFRSLANILTAQTALTIFFALTGILIMLFAEPPLEWFAGGAPYRGNRIVGPAAIALFVAFFVVLLVTPLRAFFQMVPLPFEFYVAILLSVAVWLFVQRAIWRNRWFSRFLDIEDLLREAN
ncbi:MAG: HAD-IC family P-type ATPase [Anaerolineae bacterium]|nr:HAD-IC family P-type ATPase [Anaerolineae bacterium]